MRERNDVNSRNELSYGIFWAIAFLLSAGAITPALVSGLDSALQALVQLAYNDALTPVFAVLVPVLFAAFALLLLMRERPLKTVNE